MLKMLTNTILGFLLFISAIGIVYFYLTTMDNGTTPLLLIPPVFLVAGGVFFLLRATKSDYIIGVKQLADIKAENGNATGEGKNIIERNNELSAEWAKTVEKRDKMRVLEMAASAAEKPPTK